jgi:hypothetical protein
MKININLFFSLYRREWRDRQRNLFDLIDICNHTAHDFFLIIILFVYLSVYSIRSEKVRVRENGTMIHHSLHENWFLFDLGFNCSTSNEHNIGKWTVWSHKYFLSQLTVKRHRATLFFLLLTYVIQFHFLLSGQSIDHLKWLYTWLIREKNVRLTYSHQQQKQKQVSIWLLTRPYKRYM